MPTYLQRYSQSPEFSHTWHQHARTVWAELVSFGAAIRTEPLFSEAHAVAHAMMTRARHNIELIVPRLHELGYQFAYPDQVWTPPTPASSQLLDRLARDYGPLPLVLRMWFDVVGSVNLMGFHPKLSHYADFAAHVSMDQLRHGEPLVVETKVFEVGIDRYAAREEDFYEVPIAPDGAFKEGTSGGGSIVVLVPNPAFDAPLIDPGEIWTGSFFVHHLQASFAWGGFPGLAESAAATDAKAELAFLQQGLLPLL